MVLPDTRLEIPQRMMRGPVCGECAARWIPQSGMGSQIRQKLVQHPQPVREGDGVGVQHHVEAASAQILGLEFAAPIAEERVRMLQSRTLGGKQQKELIIEVIVVWQAEQCATACEIRDPPMRRIIGQAIAEPLVPRIQEQIHGMRTDGARCKFV